MRMRLLPILLLLGCAAACGGGDDATGSGDAGAGTNTASDAIVPFTIDVPDDVLEDLQARLEDTRFPDELEGADWTYGANLAYMRELVAYWRDDYDWREQERRLNRFDHFKTNIDGLDIHFIHQRSANPDAFPLMVIHGWPGSFVEFHKIIEPLSDPASHGGDPADAFHLVIPSLPGFGFSDRPREAGYTPERMAEVFAKLMARLGYTRYGLQGGDYGALISRLLGRIDAEHIAGIHLNLCSVGPPPGVEDPLAGVPPEELALMRDRLAFWTAEERGYSAIQSTKPQTIGYVLNDSPVGQAAWIVEKFRALSDVNGDVESKFTKDEMLTNVMVYWVTQTATSAARVYYEVTHAPNALAGGAGDAPLACTGFPKEISFPPTLWLEAQFNLTQRTIMPRGGHFAALEEPELLLEDVRTFYRTIR